MQHEAFSILDMMNPYSTIAEFISVYPEIWDKYDSKMHDYRHRVVQRWLLFDNPATIKDFNDPSEEMQILAISGNVRVMKFIKRPTVRTQLRFLELYPTAFKLIRNPCRAARKKAFELVMAQGIDFDDPEIY